jgi:hypothetical protein
MKRITIIGITLTLLLSLALWQKQTIVAAKISPPATTTLTTQAQAWLNIRAV